MLKYLMSKAIFVTKWVSLAKWQRLITVSPQGINKSPLIQIHI